MFTQKHSPLPAWLRKMALACSLFLAFALLSGLFWFIQPGQAHAGASPSDLPAGDAPTASRFPLNTFVVNSTLDLPDIFPGTGGCDATVTTPTVCTLRAAIMEANASGGADLIILPAGIYTLTLVGSDDLANVGDLDLRSAITLSGAGPALSIIDGNAIDRVFDVILGSAVISGVTIQNGQAVNGGGVRMEPASTSWLQLVNATIQNNQADNGAGVYVKESYASPQMLNVTIRENHANSQGGGIYCTTANQILLEGVTFANNTAVASGGGLTNSCQGYLTNVSFISNTVSGPTADGGGLFNANNLIVSNLLLQGNSAPHRGGGIYNNGWINGSQLNFSDNQADQGGGAYIDNAGTVIWSQGTFNQNQAATQGGGLHSSGDTTLSYIRIGGNTASYAAGIFNAGELTIEHSTVDANQADQHAGGIYNQGSLSLQASTISSNTAGTDGGGLYLIGGIANLVNDTISNNYVPDGSLGSGIWMYAAAQMGITNTTLVSNTNGAGLFLYQDFIHRPGLQPQAPGEVRFLNSLLAFNSPVNCAKDLIAPDFISAGHNLESMDSCNFHSPGDQIHVAQPGIGGLGDNGGATLTHALLVGSPAIDAGDDQGCPVYDQRDHLRAVDGICDIGSFEFEHGTDPAIDLYDNVDPVLSLGKVRYTILVTNTSPYTTTELIVTDTLPVEILQYQFNAEPGWTCFYGEGDVVCDYPALGPGITSTIWITVTAPQVTGTNRITLTSFAVLYSARWDSDLSNNQDSEQTLVIPQGIPPEELADVSIQIHDQPDPANVGELITYTLTVANAGPFPAQAPVVTSTMSADLVFFRSIGLFGCTEDPGIVTCRAESLNQGETQPIIIVYQAPDTGGTIYYQADIGSRNPDPDPDNNHAQESTKVNQMDIGISMQGNTGIVPAGSPIAYTIHIENLGTVMANVVTVTLNIPVSGAVTGWAGAGWNCVTSQAQIACGRTNLGAGSASDLVINLKAPTISNHYFLTARASSPADSNLLNNAASLDFIIQTRILIPTLKK